MHRGAREAELLAQAAPDEPHVAGVQPARGEQDDSGRAALRLSAEEDARLLPAAHRVRVGRDDAPEEGVEPAGGDAGPPALQRDIDGLTTLEDFADLTGHALPEGPYDTLAGFFMARYGAIPRVGESITVALAPLDPEADESEDEVPPEDPFLIGVTQMDGRRIAWLSVQALDAGAPGAGRPAGSEAGQQGERPVDSNAAVMAADSQARTNLAAGLQRADERTPGVLP